MGHWPDHFQGVFVEYDYKVGTIINEQAPADSLEAKQPYVDNGIGIVDKSRYYDRDFMALEWERLWTKTWQIAAVTADLPEVGSYSVFDIGRESIIKTKWNTRCVTGITSTGCVATISSSSISTISTSATG